MAGQKNWCCIYCIDLWSQMGQRTSTAQKSKSGTMPVQLQQWHPCEWQDTMMARSPRQAKQPLHDGWYRNRQICQRPSNPDLPQHKRGSPWENWSLPTRMQLFCTTWFLLRTVLNSASWLYQSGDSDAAACCYRDVGPKGPNNKHSGVRH